ncbi:hypothetical protein Peur_048024 [Populus x canadensis]
MWLDKNTGVFFFSISSKGLAITGIDYRRYWNHISTEESSNFILLVLHLLIPHSFAYLQDIWWFVVDGEFGFEFPEGTYSLFFRLQLGRSSKRMGRRVSNSLRIHGWDIKPVRFQLTTSDGFHCQGNELMKKFSMTQIDLTHTKGDLRVDAAFVYPSSVGREICRVN